MRLIKSNLFYFYVWYSEFLDQSSIPYNTVSLKQINDRTYQLNIHDAAIIIICNSETIGNREREWYRFSFLKRSQNLELESALTTMASVLLLKNSWTESISYMSKMSDRTINFETFIALFSFGGSSWKHLLIGFTIIQIV